MKSHEFLMELRKNPEQNPKVTVNTELYTELNRVLQSNDLINNKYPNLFISFTEVDKLGINPQSKYDTPLGIYAYPAKYIKQKIGDRGMDKLPFAGESQYATIFKARGNIVNVAAMSNSDVKTYYQKIVKYWSQVSGKDQKTLDSINQLIKDSTDKAKFNSKPGGQFWYVTMVVAKMLAKLNAEASAHLYLNNYDYSNFDYPSSVTWNTLFRAIGISGCLDTGSGIIHTSEPYQAVFFDINAIDVIKQIENRINYTPSLVKKQIKTGEQKKNSMILGFNMFRKMSSAAQRNKVLRYPENIRFMPNPSEELQWEACKRNPAAIAGIKNPSEQLQLWVVNQDGANIEYVLRTVRNPSQAVQIASIKAGTKWQEGVTYCRIIAFYILMSQGRIRPSPAVQMTAFEEAPKKTLEFMKYCKINPCEEVKLATIEWQKAEVAKWEKGEV